MPKSPLPKLGKPKTPDKPSAKAPLAVITTLVPLVSEVNLSNRDDGRFFRAVQSGLASVVGYSDIQWKAVREQLQTAIGVTDKASPEVKAISNLVSGMSAFKRFHERGLSADTLASLGRWKFSRLSVLSKAYATDNAEFLDTVAAFGEMGRTEAMSFLDTFRDADRQPSFLAAQRSLAKAIENIRKVLAQYANPTVELKRDWIANKPFAKALVDIAKASSTLYNTLPAWFLEIWGEPAQSVVTPALEPEAATV